MDNVPNNLEPQTRSRPPENLRDFKSLLEIMEALRGPGGCPWDHEQTHVSLSSFAIEEAHELAEAIESGQQKSLIEELGDLLLQVVFHSEIGRQEQRFQIEDVIEAICTKMIRRHPHVFGEVSVTDSSEVLNNWQKIKESEKESLSNPVDRFPIPSSLPALQRSQKIGHETKAYQFDWTDVDGVLAKVDEEILELKEALKNTSQEGKTSELGDVLFTLAQLGRHLQIDAEQALRQANNRFERRFFDMKDLAQKRRLDLKSIPPEDLDQLWQEAKLLERYRLSTEANNSD